MPVSIPPNPTETLYWYRAKVTNVHDGDTCTVDIDLGMKLWAVEQHVRFYGINTPELHGAEKAAAEKARDFLKEMILGKTILLHTVKDKTEKYGRYLGKVWVEIEPGKWINVNDELVRCGSRNACEARDEATRYDKLGAALQ